MNDATQIIDKNFSFGGHANADPAQILDNGFKMPLAKKLPG
jgi:hypothetical protein